MTQPLPPGIHPATAFWLGFFETAHLHPALRPIVQDFKDLAVAVAESSSNQATTEAVKALVHAKDQTCRAFIHDGGIEQWEASHLPGPGYPPEGSVPPPSDFLLDKP